MEIWKDVKGFESIYQVSNTGKIKSLARLKPNNGGFFMTKERILKPGKNKSGYYQVILEKDGKRTSKRVHRIVAETFLDNPNNYPQINHINKNKLDNNLSNLEWCTNQYNAEYSHAKTINLYDKYGNLITVFNINKFCKENGIHFSNLLKVLKGQRNHTGGYRACN